MHDVASRLLDRNLALLGPEVRRALQSGAGSGAPTDTRVVSNSSGRLSIRGDDGREIAVHGSDDPEAASDALVRRLTAAAPPPHLVVIGLGLGYLLDALERANVPTKVLAVEPVPATVRAMLERRDWAAWLTTNRLRLLVGPTFAGAAEAWRLFGANSPKPPTIMAPYVERGFPADAARAKSLVAHILAGVQANDEARRRFAGRYLLNTLANLPVIAVESDAAVLTDAFAGVPAIVVGAGPSLDRNMPMLAAAKGRALIVAVDTATRAMLAAGVVPDLVVAVDPSELNGRHLRDLPDPARLWVVAEGSLDPPVFAPFAGRLFMFRVSQHQPWPWLASLGVGRGQLRAWGSVLTTAFDLACVAGCDPIVFAGADLAYSRGLQYCRNTTYEPHWQHLKTDGERADSFKEFLRANATTLAQPDVHGAEVTTTPHFVQFRDWIVARAAELSGRRVINATGDGILHGSSIEQVTGFRPPVQRLDVEATMRRAWSSGETARTDSRRQLAAALQSNATLPMAAWLDFAGDTTSSAQILERVGDAHRRLSGLTPV
jgi:hypothetical protein